MEPDWYQSRPSNKSARLNAAASRPDLPYEPIPTIAEIASVVPQEVMIAFELKSDAFIKADTCKRLVTELQNEFAPRESCDLILQPPTPDRTPIG